MLEVLASDTVPSESDMKQILRSNKKECKQTKKKEDSFMVLRGDSQCLRLFNPNTLSAFWGVTRSFKPYVATFNGYCTSYMSKYPFSSVEGLVFGCQKPWGSECK